MESGFPLYFSCITGQGHFLGFAWKGRLDWAVKEQENMSGLEHETHKSIPLLSYIYRDLQLYQILKDWLSLKNILMQKARFTLCTKNRQAAAFSSIISQQVQLTAHHCCQLPIETQSLSSPSSHSPKLSPFLCLPGKTESHLSAVSGNQSNWTCCWNRRNM